MTQLGRRPALFFNFVSALIVGLATGPLAALSDQANHNWDAAPDSPVEMQSNDSPNGDEVIPPGDKGWIDSVR